MHDICAGSVFSGQQSLRQQSDKLAAATMLSLLRARPSTAAGAAARRLQAATLHFDTLVSKSSCCAERTTTNQPGTRWQAQHGDLGVALPVDEVAPPISVTTTFGFVDASFFVVV